MAETITTKLLILGGGPGGYVAAIRAGQLGIDTVLVEGDRLGGTCLNVGCIPSKALIHVASKFEGMAEAAHGGRDGISLKSAPVLDMAQTVAWKETVVDKLNGGVTALLKRAKTRVGRPVVCDAKTTCRERKDRSPSRPRRSYWPPDPSPPPRRIPFGGDGSVHRALRQERPSGWW